MKKLLLLLLFLPFFGFSQCNEIPETEVKLTSLTGVVTKISLCYDDSLDIMVVKQLRKPRVSVVENSEMGEYFLKKDYCIIFTSDKKEFKSKLLKENYYYSDSTETDIEVYRYYVVSKNKLRLILNQNVDKIDIVKDNEIDTFELTNKESIGLYHMVYNYYRLRGWK